MNLKFSNNVFVWTGGFQTKDLPKAAGFRWSPDDRCWWTDKPEVAAKLRDHADDTCKTTIDAALQKKAQTVVASQATSAAIDIPAPTGLEYLPFQKAGIAYALDHQNCLIGDDMGLGKTIQAIGVINADASIKSVLVVCPASLRINWQREMQKWITRPMSIGFANGSLPDTDIVIINYDILKKHTTALRARQWDLLIADECHYIKNGKAARTQQLIGGGKGDDKIAPIPAKRKLFLTGTPILNRPCELWTSVHFLEPRVFGNWKYFHEQYCAAEITKYGWDISGASNLDELQRKLRETIMVRRLKTDVLKELPEKRRQVIVLPANGCTGKIAEENAAVEAIESRLVNLRAAVELAKAANNEDYETAVNNLRSAQQAAFTEISKLRHETALAKVDYAIEHISDAAEAGKIVVFAHHHDVIEKLYMGLRDLNPVVLTGETSMIDRQAAVDRFQGNKDCKIFIGSIKAAGVGLTLTASAHVIFVELDWVPGTMTQAEDRCHRIGQKDAVLVQHLILDGSIDQRLAETLIEKQVIIEKALNGGGQALADATRPIILDISVAETHKTSRSEIVEAATKLTPEEIEKAHEGLQRLAAMDWDHARDQNGVGFNKIDGRIGHQLANLPQLSPAQGVIAMRLCNKYRRQL